LYLLHNNFISREWTCKEKFTLNDKTCIYSLNGRGSEIFTLNEKTIKDKNETYTLNENTWT